MTSPARILPPRTLPSAACAPVQSLLIHVVESDDLYLENLEGLVWFEVLRGLKWEGLRPIAARYYEALWRFNEAKRGRCPHRAIHV